MDFNSSDEDLEKSETAKATLLEWTEAKVFVQEVIDEIEKEATSISTVSYIKYKLFINWKVF